MSDMQEFIQQPKLPHQCYHYLDNTHRCEATAMTGDYFCHDHRITPAPIIYLPAEGFALPDLKDRESIQRAVSQIADRIAGNQIDNKRAGLLLFAIQIASSNLPPHCRTSAAAEAPKPAAQRDEVAQPAAQPAAQLHEQPSGSASPVLPDSPVIPTLNEGKGKNPGLPPESPINPAPTATVRTVPPSQSATLPKLQAVASPQPSPNPAFWRSRNLIFVSPVASPPRRVNKQRTTNNRTSPHTSISL